MVPAAREKVRIQGRTDEYIVLAVDHDLEISYVIHHKGHGCVETVHLHALMPAGQDAQRDGMTPRSDS